jgi:hypothetical protein
MNDLCRDLCEPCIPRSVLLAALFFSLHRKAFKNAMDNSRDKIENANTWRHTSFTLLLGAARCLYYTPCCRDWKPLCIMATQTIFPAFSSSKRLAICQRQPSESKNSFLFATFPLHHHSYRQTARSDRKSPPNDKTNSLNSWFPFFFFLVVFWFIPWQITMTRSK